MSADKAIHKCLPFIGQLVHNNSADIYCTAANHPRAIAAKDLRQMLHEVCHPSEAAEQLSPNDGTVAYSIQQAVIDSLQSQQHQVSFDDLVFVPVTSSNSSLHQSIDMMKNPLSTQPLAKQVIIVCGTAFIMSDVRHLIGVIEPEDGDILGGSDTAKSTSTTTITTTATTTATTTDSTSSTNTSH